MFEKEIEVLKHAAKTVFEALMDAAKQIEEHIDSLEVDETK